VAKTEVIYSVPMLTLERLQRAFLFLLQFNYRSTNSIAILNRGDNALQASKAERLSRAWLDERRSVHYPRNDVEEIDRLHILISRLIQWG